MPSVHRHSRLLGSKSTVSKLKEWGWYEKYTSHLETICNGYDRVGEGISGTASELDRSREEHLRGREETTGVVVDGVEGEG